MDMAVFMLKWYNHGDTAVNRNVICLVNDSDHRGLHLGIIENLYIATVYRLVRNWVYLCEAIQQSFRVPQMSQIGQGLNDIGPD